MPETVVHASSDSSRGGSGMISASLAACQGCSSFAPSRYNYELGRSTTGMQHPSKTSMKSQKHHAVHWSCHSSQPHLPIPCYLILPSRQAPPSRMVWRSCWRELRQGTIRSYASAAALDSPRQDFRSCCCYSIPQDRAMSTNLHAYCPKLAQ